jgi:protein phosphatase-4 regulatory subunit 3
MNISSRTIYFLVLLACSNVYSFASCTPPTPLTCCADDPEFPVHKANYREFLHSTSNFHQPIPIRDATIQRKIHHTYRLQFMKDVVLARALDDSTFNVLNSCIIFNQIDIINHVQHDVGFLKDVVGLYVDEDMLSGGGMKKKETESKVVEGEGMEVDKSPSSDSKTNGVVSNGRTSRARQYLSAPPEEISEEEKLLRNEVVFLIQQLCVMGKNVQLPARMALFRALVDRGILFAVQWALALPEKDEKSRPVISASGEVLAALLDHDLNGVRGHVLKQVVAIEKEREAGKKGADKADTILALMCKMMAQSRELAVQCQVGDALKVLLEITQNEGPEPHVSFLIPCVLFIYIEDIADGGWSEVAASQQG